MMSKAVPRKRLIMLALAVLLASVLGLGVTLAWQSNTQVRLNSFKNLYLPNANLHDDYIAPDGADTYTLRPNKDVYVENSGNTMVYLRVRLTEYLQTQHRGSLVQGHRRDEANANQWAPHNGAGSTVASCVIPQGAQVSSEWQGEYFHDYYRWIMGNTATPNGQIYYRPAPAEHKGSYDAVGNLTSEPTVVTDPNAGVGPHYNPAQLYAQRVQEQLAQGSTEAEAMAALGLQKTLPARVITMQNWINGNPEQGFNRLSIGNMWVIDEKDGWAYWASPLREGEATGLLLDGVERTPKQFDSTAEYCINVVLQAVDLDDIDKLWSTMTGGATDEGETLLKIISGQLVLGGDDREYINNGDGSYRLKNPKAGEDARSFVPLVEPSVNVPDRIYVGQRFTVDELLWDGADYTNWDTVIATTTQPLYNLSPVSSDDTAAVIAAGTPVYELVGSVIGWDGNVYLQIARVEKVASAADSGLQGELYLPSDSTCYLGSLAATAMATQASLDPWTNPNARYSYTHLYPGNGPYAFLWSDATGDITSPTDPNLNIGGGYFHHLGDGVYLRVAHNGAVESVDTPVRYYFSTREYTKTSIDAIPGKGQQQIDGFFPLQLSEGERFDVTYPTPTDGTSNPAAPVEGEPVTPANPTTYRAAVASYHPAANGSYTMEPVLQGQDGHVYLHLVSALGDMGYLCKGNNAYLGDSGDWRIWLGDDGIAGTDDDTYMGEFDESYLPCIAKAELAEGYVFGVDGHSWVVISTDDKGNRLIMSTTTIAEMGARAGTPPAPAYADTLWPARAETFMGTLPSLKQVVRTAILPDEPVCPGTTGWSEIAITDGISHCIDATTDNYLVPLPQGGYTQGYRAFPLSAGEHCRYIIEGSKTYPALEQYKIAKDKAGNAVISGLRSRDSDFERTGALSIGSNGIRYSAWSNSKYSPRMAMWVRLSDADRIATDTPADLAAWRNQ